MKVFYWLLAVVIGGVIFAIPDTATVITRRYGSLPKGVILEGEARGFAVINTIKYLSDKNQFIINQEDLYAVPVSREVLYQIVMALARDNRIGVSLTSTDDAIVYGQLEKTGAAAQQLLLADKILTAVILGDREALTGLTLPENFAPQVTVERRYPAVCVHKLFDYGFAKKDNRYYRNEIKMANLLFPMSAKRAADGGYLASEAGVHNLEPLDLENLATLRNYSQEYLEVLPIKAAADIGEVAAFVRYLRDSGNLDLIALGRHIMRK